MQGIAQNLRTNFEVGLTPIDFEQRNEQYGSNKKPPMKRTPFFTLFFGALDDFMLKLLLVCACVSISIDLGFAEGDDRNTGKQIYRFPNEYFCSLD
jgi:magnesium-transporting ATPase (P-type)